MKSVSIDLKNKTTFTDKDLLKVVKFCLPTDLVGNIKVIIKQSKSWDGTAWPSLNKVEVIIPPDKTFPTVIDINHELPGSYLRQVFLENSTAFLVWLLSHELMHLLIYQYPEIVNIKQTLIDFMEWDEETLCDTFGLTMLNKYRRSLNKK